MVVTHNPCCPVSFGLVGFLSAIISRRSSLYHESNNKSNPEDKSEEEEDLLAVGDADCDELTEDRITSFLESQKQQYYRSIGIGAPKQLKTIETSTTPGASMIEFSSSRETSYIEEGDESALLNLETSSPLEQKSAFTPQTFRMDEESEHYEEVAETRPDIPNFTNDLLDSDLVVETGPMEDDEGFITPTSPEDALLSP